MFSGVSKNYSQVDTFDCRMRLWYIDASLSPKDVIILVDNSGSMMTSHDVARHVVNSILETLGSNDFFNVLMFNDTVAPVISCLHNDTLIQVRAQCSPTTMITKMKLFYRVFYLSN